MMLLKTSMTLQNRQSVMLKEIWMPAWIMRIMSGMFNGMQTAGRKGAAPRQKIIVDRLGYNEAKKCEAMAKAELNRYKGQVDNWKRQMNAAESCLKKAENEKEVLANKIENFTGQTHVKIFCFKSLNYYLKNAQNGKIPLGWNYAFKRKSGRNRRF